MGNYRTYAAIPSRHAQLAIEATVLVGCLLPVGGPWAEAESVDEYTQRCLSHRRLSLSPCSVAQRYRRSSRSRIHRLTSAGL